MINPIVLNFIWRSLKETFLSYGENALLLRSAALSYYTIFSLPPFLLILLKTTSIFYDKEVTQRTIFKQMGAYFGEDSAEQIIATIDSIGIWNQEGWALIVGVLGMLFTATTIFVTVQETMNIVFKAEKFSEKMGWWHYVRGRLVALGLLLAIAFIMIITLTANAMVARLVDQLGHHFPAFSTAILYLLSLLLPIFVTGFFFTLIFRYLPDREISWSTARMGAFITLILFLGGQYAISYYIGMSNINNMYEAAGSIMAVMVWIFYASAIFYFGAQFTAVYHENLKAVDE